ncbi:serine protease inhibitor Cvsi-2-like [Ruditapes philippinarum]|uniref:serine protease inhibitor Cvsi-2-like n=1 Tax=Ruditapes philippinarum TaxID=129788 RepID=UPI00295BA6A0|nr:serine protease inhibitor Cvsi-2-like [Ruditapes philippinarum]
MIKFAVIAAVTVYICYVAAEICSNVGDCKGTSCSTTATHVHVECVERHCTCSQDQKPCLTVSDCSANASCIDRDGHTTKFHCLDGKCNCLRV